MEEFLKTTNAEATISGQIQSNFKDPDGNSVAVWDLRGKVGVTKPTKMLGYKIGVGSTFIEIGGDSFMFDGTNWLVM